jgi:adenosylhomocysteine nucleosidase
MAMVTSTLSLPLLGGSRPSFQNKQSLIGRSTRRILIMPEQAPAHTIVLIAANTEWRVVRSQYPEPQLHSSPFGDWFVVTLDVGDQAEPVIFFHGGWGKIAAAAATQYAIDRWSPAVLINLGTCGGFAGEIAKGTILLVERTIVYDIVEMMSDYEAAIASYTTTLDLSWLSDSYPHEVRPSLLVSADRDVQVEEIAQLKARFGAIAGDWESGRLRMSRPTTTCAALFCGALPT